MNGLLAHLVSILPNRNKRLGCTRDLDGVENISLTASLRIISSIEEGCGRIPGLA